jgi:peptidoglycan/xylan/chitin deacetylase (PgdA/CDA1 family)
MPVRDLPPLTLAYHGVADVPLSEDPHYLFVSARDLRRHIARLRAWGYQLVTFGDLARHAVDGRAAGLAALTFDDGFSDNHATLLPLLREVAAPATVFVTTGWMGQPHPVAPRHARTLTPEQVRELHAAGVEIGCHTRTHPDLTAIPEEAAREELAGSRDLLEALLDSPVRVAAYPYGRANDAVRRAAASAGLAFACRALGEGRWEDPFDQPRQDMRNRGSLLGLRLKRDGRYTPMMRRRSWRALRRARQHVLGRPL